MRSREVNFKVPGLESWPPRELLCRSDVTAEIRKESRGSSVSVVTTLRAGRPGFDSQQGIFLFAHPASYPMGTRGPFPGGKAAGA
jgi:hypothetical protein